MFVRVLIAVTRSLRIVKTRLLITLYRYLLSTFLRVAYVFFFGGAGADRCDSGPERVVDGGKDWGAEGAIPVQLRQSYVMKNYVSLVMYDGQNPATSLRSERRKIDDSFKCIEALCIIVRQNGGGGGWRGAGR